MADRLLMKKTVKRALKAAKRSKTLDKLALTLSPIRQNT
jgi:hypothetical protein